jgi:hypothetical protein
VKKKHFKMKDLVISRPPKIMLVFVLLLGLSLGSFTPVYAAPVPATFNATQSGTSLSLRVDYGPVTSIASDDTIEIRLSAAASSIIKIVGFVSTAPIFGTIEGVSVEVGTRTYSYDGEVCVLSVVFNSAYSDAGLINIAGWYTAEARIEYKETTTEVLTTIQVEINGGGVVTGPTITIPAGGPGIPPGSTEFVPGNKFSKFWRYGDTDGNGGGQFTLDGDFSQFAEMRWFVRLGYGNLTNRNMRATYDLPTAASFWTTAEALAYSNNNSTAAGYNNEAEPYLEYYYLSGGTLQPLRVNEPFHYNNVIIDDYLDIGPNYGTILCSAHDYIRDSIRIVRIIGRDNNGTVSDQAYFRSIADSNFLIPHDGRNIDQIFRHFNQTIFNGYRGLTLEEFFNQMKAEGQFAGYTNWDQIITFDTVDNHNYYGLDSTNQVPHFQLRLGDMHFSDGYAGRVTGVKQNNTISEVINDVPAKNLPYAYLIYYDTEATGADIGESSNYYYFNRATLTYDGGSGNVDFSPLWVKHEASGGGGTYASLKIKKVDEYNVPIQGIEFTLTRAGGSPLIRYTNATGDITFAVSSTGEYTLAETVPEGSSLIPIAPITFEITGADLLVGQVDVSSLLDDITYAGGVNTVVNRSTEPGGEPGVSGPAEIKIRKAVSGVSSTLNPFTFSGVQVQNAEGDPFEAGDPIELGPVTTSGAITSASGREITISTGLLEAENTYYFKITEDKANVPPDWTYSDAAYIITVTVDNQGVAAVSYPAGYSSSNPPVFTNSYSEDNGGGGNGGNGGGGGGDGDWEPDDPPSGPGEPETPDEPFVPEEPGETGPPDGSGTSQETNTLDEPDIPIAPQTPGGTDPDIPPRPTTPGNTLVPDGDGYIEFDEDGVPLGRWDWDDEEEMWLYDEFPPLGGLPQTGEAGIPLFIVLLIGLTLAKIGVMRLTPQFKRGKHDSQRKGCGT